MSVVVEIEGREALPIWTIPYVTGRFPSPDKLMTLLSNPDDLHSVPTFPTAFNLNGQGKPTPLPPSQWDEYANQMVRLENDLDKKNQPDLDDRKEWFKKSIEIIMQIRAYVWLDEFQAWFSRYLESIVDDHVGIFLNPIMLAEHGEHFERTEKHLIRQVVYYDGGIPGFMLGEPELPYQESVSFYQAKALFDKKATDEEFALHVFDGLIRVYQDGREHEHLRPIYNIKNWLLAHGKVETFCGEPEPTDVALSIFRFSKPNLTALKPEYRYLHFDKAKEAINNFLCDSAKAERFLMMNLQNEKTYAYHPYFGLVFPELSQDGERWKKCYIKSWGVEQLVRNLPDSESETESELGKDRQKAKAGIKTNRRARRLDWEIEQLLSKTMLELIEKSGLDEADGFTFEFNLSAWITQLSNELESLNPREYTNKKDYDDRVKSIYSKLEEIELLQHELELGDAGKTQTKSDKPRKKLKPLERERNESLLLIYEITKQFNVQYLDELPANKAWGKIVAKEFTSDLIKKIAENDKSITLNGGEVLTKSDFCEKYRSRFQ